MAAAQATGQATAQVTAQATWEAGCAAFAQREGAAAWLQQLRRCGAERFAALRFPSRHAPAWHHTDLTALAAQPREVAPAGAGAARSAGSAAGASADTASGASPCAGATRGAGHDADGGAALAARLAALPRLGCRLVFVDGHFDAGLSDAPPAGACCVTSLAAAQAAGDDDVRAYLGQTAGHEAHPLNALNTAYLHDGAFVRIAEGQQAAPLELVFIARGAAADMAHPRVVVAAGAGSRASIVERYVGCGDAPTWVNGVSELFLADEAQLTYTVLQEQEAQTTHVGQTHARLARSARLEATLLAAGGALARHETHVRLLAPDAACQLRGVALGAGRAHRDVQVHVCHEAERGSSEQDFRSVLDEHAVGVFFGRVHVLPRAQKTQARQLSKNLLLAPQASAHTRPQLEILADDVKCNHGATVGALAPEAIFYLQSRGIAVAVARQMLTHAFVAEVLDGLPPAPRAAALGCVRQRLGGATEAA